MNPSESDTQAADQPAFDVAAALLGEDPELDLAGLAAAAHTDPQTVARYWRALGLSVGDPADVAFTHNDADAIRELTGTCAQEGFDAATVTSLVRSVGHTMDRLSLWQVEALVDAIVRRDMNPGEDPENRAPSDDIEARREVLRRLPALAPMLERQLLHAWRRQLAALAGRYEIEFGPGAEQTTSHLPSDLPLPRAVGFADIVGFTRRSGGLPSSQLATAVQDFENAARDVVTAGGGRVVKTIGDAVLYIADHLEDGARIATGLAGLAPVFGPELDPPHVRVSLVWGRVLARFGDVFGFTVNLASRLCEVAGPGEVVCDAHTASLLAGLPAGDLPAAISQHDLPGVGLVDTVAFQVAPAPVAVAPRDGQ